MVMEAVGSAASAVGEALGLVKPDKAKLKCVGSNLPDGDTEVECSFNPTDYTLTQAIEVPSSPTPAKEGGQQQYNGTAALTFKANLFFDAFSELEGDVTPKITTLLNWMKPTGKSGSDGRHSPPLVQFVWGGNPQLDQLHGFITNLDVKYTLFRKDGTPVRADVTITIKNQVDPKTGQNPTSRAARSRRVHQLVEGDTLQSVAYKELGKAAHWRSIAELNGIDDPMRLATGTVLLIPTVADATRNP
jgi:nucleoid-associated protein YgaU